MIKQTTPVTTWKQAMQQCYSDVDSLLAALGLTRQDMPEVLADATFPIRVPTTFVERMRYGDPHDPLLRQVLPLAEESKIDPAYMSDPLNEKQSVIQPGVIQKYDGRLLVILTGACAVHCRYCFRQHFPYNDHIKSRQQLAGVIQYVSQSPDVNEVILSGGDPLMLDDAKLALWLEALHNVPTIKRIRLHTRVPVVLPERFDQGCLQLLERVVDKGVMVIHSNHANELDEAVAGVITALRNQGWLVFNQAVLLAGINDDFKSQFQHNQRLIDIGVVPYYLHLLDKVAGSQHFDVEPNRAKQLYQQMLEQMPGYMVPRVVREVPGVMHKVAIDRL